MKGRESRSWCARLADRQMQEGMKTTSLLREGKGREIEGRRGKERRGDRGVRGASYGARTDSWPDQ